MGDVERAAAAGLIIGLIIAVAITSPLILFLSRRPQLPQLPPLPPEPMWRSETRTEYQPLLTEADRRRIVDEVLARLDRQATLYHPSEEDESASTLPPRRFTRRNKRDNEPSSRP
jgi:hypothetical protein